MPAKVIPTKTTPAKTMPTKISPAKIALAKIALAKGKGKAKEETNVKLDFTIETIILIATKLGAYYKEAYCAGRYTLIITNNLLVNF
jgi:hypothetical protein